MTDELIRSTLMHVPNAQRGEEHAWDRLVAKIREETTRCISANSLPSGMDLEDLTQIASVSAFQSLKTFEGLHPDSFRRWVRTILRNRVTDLWRRSNADKRKVQEVAVALDAENDDGWSPAGDLQDADAYTPLVELEAREGEARMREAEAGLKDTHQTVLRLREEEGLDYAKIAEQMDLVNGDAARFLTHYARRRRADAMRDYFQSQEM